MLQSVVAEPLIDIDVDYLIKTRILHKIDGGESDGVPRPIRRSISMEDISGSPIPSVKTRYT